MKYIQGFQESVVMSIFSWLSGATGAVKPDSHIAQSHRLVAPGATSQQESAKTHRHMRREQLYLAIREAMTRSGVLSFRYRFKVSSLDQRGDTFLVMMDLSQQQGPQTEIPPDIEKKIMLQAMTRFAIVVSSVYWRFNASVLEQHPAPESKKTAEFGNPVDRKPSLSAVHKTTAFDELAAFREARLSAAKRKYPAPAPEAKKLKPALQKASRQADFEDTELVDDTPLPGLSATQYGDLN